MILDVVKIAGWITAISVIGGATWAVGDYTETRPILEREFHTLEKHAEDISRSVLTLRFYFLLDKMKQNGALSYEEQSELCNIARELQFTGVPGCTNG